MQRWYSTNATGFAAAAAVAPDVNLIEPNNSKENIIVTK